MLIRDRNFMLERRKIKTTLNFARSENLKKISIKGDHIKPFKVYVFKLEKGEKKAIY